MISLQDSNTTVPTAPTVVELEKVLFGGKRFGNPVDEVWPNLFIGDL